MKAQQIIPALVLMVLVILLSGCATGGGSGGNNRGSLSTATNEAATKEAADKEEPKGRGEGRTRTRNEVYENPTVEVHDDDDGDGVLGLLGGVVWSLFSGGDDEQVETYESDNSQTDEPIESSYNEFGMPPDENEPPAKAEKRQGPRPKSMIFWYSPSWLAGDAIQGFSNFSLLYSVTRSRKVRVHIGPYYGAGTIGSQENLREGLRYLDEWGLDTGLRVFLNPENPGREMYLLMGLRIGALDWKYSQPVEAADGSGGTVMITNDGVGVFTPYLGLGTSFLRAGNFQIGASFTMGARLSVDETFEGYDNDVFPSVGEYKLNIEASIFF